MPGKAIRNQLRKKETEMMRTLFKSERFAGIFLLCCALLAASASRLAAQTQPKPAPAQITSTLTVKVTGLRNATGKVRLTLMRDSNTVEKREAEIDAGTLSAQTVFENLPQGVYSVFVFQDENMNGKMDFDEMGIPLEGYGASNNPEKRMGPPDPDEAKFTVNQPKVAIEIKLIYW
jgi:uncharacterized protein (DUF2141 family)